MIETEPRDDTGRDTYPKTGQAEVFEALSRKADMPVKKIELYPPTAAHDDAVEAARLQVKEAANKPRTYDDPGYENLIRNAAASGPVEDDRMATPAEVRAAMEAGPRHGGGQKGLMDRARSGFRRLFGRSQPKH